MPGGGNGVKREVQVPDSSSPRAAWSEARQPALGKWRVGHGAIGGAPGYSLLDVHTPTAPQPAPPRPTSAHLT